MSCSRIEYVEKPSVEFPLPEPVETRSVKWRVLTKETLRELPTNAVFVGLSWEDSLKHRQWLEDIKVYIQKQQIIICNHQSCKEIK